MITQIKYKEKQNAVFFQSLKGSATFCSFFAMDNEYLNCDHM